MKNAEMTQLGLREDSKMVKKIIKHPPVPLYAKLLLTLEEMAAYSGIGINKLRELSDEPACKFVLFVGTKRLLKRELFEEYIVKQYSI